MKRMREWLRTSKPELAIEGGDEMDGLAELASTGMPLREIPIEVWENVIDELQDDQRPLLACARVCRGWTARSRLHLRKWHMLQRPEQVARPVKLVRAGSWEVESCRRVEIGASRSEVDASLRTLDLFAVMFSGKMPHLEELSLRNGHWVAGEMHMDSVFLHLSTFTSITHLSLWSVTLPSVQTLGRLLSALPGLTTLYCGLRIEFQAHDLRLGAFLRRPRHLATLDLHVDTLATLHDVGRLLVGTEMASTVLNDIRASWPIDLRDLHRSGIPALVSSVGPSLLSLDLRFMGATLATGEHAPDIDLSRLVNLQHARFGMRGSAVDWITWLCDQLANYPTSSTSLRTFTLTFYLNDAKNTDYAGINVTPCRRLDDVLSLPPFTRLKEVLLKFELFNWTVTASETFGQWVSMRFPKLTARAILRVDVHNQPPYRGAKRTSINVEWILNGS